jgi:hypothetical protein
MICPYFGGNPVFQGPRDAAPIPLLLEIPKNSVRLESGRVR